jgi:hypothetical protein
MIIFGVILSRAHGNFEQHNGVLENFNYYYLLKFHVIIIVVKNIKGTERTK